MEAEEIMQRLDTVTTLLEKVLNRLEEPPSAGNIESITATIEPNRIEMELSERLAAIEHQVTEIRASATSTALGSLRRTMPSATVEMLAKHGIGDGPVDVRTLDAALSGLSLEQRIAVKNQLQRAGAIA
jgi:hypothetical protein